MPEVKIWGRVSIFSIITELIFVSAPEFIFFLSMSIFFSENIRIIEKVFQSIVGQSLSTYH